jgi:hypothetical protein
MEVLDVLQSISNKVSSSPDFEDINAGGCAYFACFIKHHLDYIGVENQLVYIDDRGIGSPQEIIERILDDDGRGSASHVVLKMGDKYFDSNGVHDDATPFIDIYGSHKRIVPFEMSNKDYYENAIVNKRHDWSSWYNRHEANPELKRIINLNFTKWYKKQNQEATEITQVANELMSLV